MPTPASKPRARVAITRPARATITHIEIGRLSRATIPALGMRVAANQIEAAMAAIGLLQRAAPARITGHFDTRRGHGMQTFAAYRELIAQTGARLTLEVVATSRRHLWELDMLAREMKEARLQPQSIVVLPAGARPTSAHTNGIAERLEFERLIASGRHAFKLAEIGSRLTSMPATASRRLQRGLIDFAVDDSDADGSIEAIKRFFGRTPHRVEWSGVRADDDQSSCATLAAQLFVLIRARIREITPAAATGDSGFIASAHESSPRVRLAYHLFAGLSRALGNRILASKSSKPHCVQCLAYRQNRGTVLWLANLSDHPQRVVIAGMRKQLTMYGSLDAESFTLATENPIAFQALQRPLNDRPLTLNPGAVAFVGA